MSNHSVIEHRANYHFLKIEEDYVLICSQGEQYPQCKAAILAILEHWVNDKKSKGQETRVYMTYPEWIDAMYGLFRRSTIIACLNELISEGLIARSPCRRHGKDTYEYILHVQVVQERLKSLAERVEKNTRPNLNASKFKRVQKQTGVNLDGTTRPNLNGTSSDAFKNKRNVDSITEIPSSIDSKDTMVASPYVDATAHTPTDFLPEETHENDVQASRPAADPDPLPGSSVDTHAFVGAAPDVEDDTPTAHRLPAIKIGATNGHDTPADHHALLPDQPRDQVLGHPAQAVENGATDDRLSHPTHPSDPHLPGGHRRGDTDPEIHLPTSLASASTSGVQIGVNDGHTTTGDHRTIGYADGGISSSVRHDPLPPSEVSPGTQGDARDTIRHQSQPDVASASTPGEPDSPPALSRHSLQGPKDGAATGSSSEPRPSGKQLPLSLQEDEPHIKPETPRERERRIEQRQKEIWALVEEKLQTKYSKTQRQTKANTAGMENLIEDETDDQTIKDALDKLSNFWRMQFDLLKFHALIPGLLAAQVPPPVKDGKIAPQEVPVERWSMAKHKKMLKEMEANQQNLQA